MQERFNQYYLTELLASKPLRSVYLAHRVSDASQKVVVKLFDAACLNLYEESESLLQKVEWVKQFKHPHIVPVLDLGVEQGQPYIVSKYLSRGSLRHHLDRLSPQRLNLQDALHIVFQVGQALRYAHQYNILHSNIKPENIFFNKQGKVLLADFRLASFINVTKLNYKSDPHTTCYMAPEQFSGTISEKSDQYALACLAYELITGRTPFSAQGFFSTWAKQSTQQVVPLSDLIPDLPEPIERAVLTGMAKDPSERYTNVSTFLRALETISLSPASLSTPTSIRALIAPPSNTLIARGAESPDAIASDASLVATHLSKNSLATRLLDHPEQVHHKHHSSQSTEPLEAISTDTSLARLNKNSLATRLLGHPEQVNHKHHSSQSTEPLDVIPTDTSLVTRLNKNPLATRLLDHPEQVHHKHHSSQSTEPLDVIPTDTSLARLNKNSLASHLLDHPEQVNHEHHSSQSTEPLDAISTDTSLARLNKNSLASHLLNHPEQVNHKHHSSQSTEPLDAISTDTSLATHPVDDRSEQVHHEQDTSQTLNTAPSMNMETSPRQTQVESLPIGRLPQPGKPVTPTLWLAFALSSIILLIGTVTLYAIVPLRSSPASSKPVKSSPAIVTPKNPINHVTPTPQPTVETPATPPVQSKYTSVQKPLTTTPAPIAQQPIAPLVQTSLTGSYADQTNQTYNLTTEGTIDWIDWGLNTPQDVDHKANVQPQISNCIIIGNSTVQRASYSSSSYIEWSDGTPETAAAPQQTSGLYVTGVNNGFRITVPAGTTPKTLNLYLGANLAHGELTASLDGKTYNDATLDMTHDPTSTQANGVYTLVFNGNASNQVLTVTYTAIATNGSNGYVMLQAATLH